MGINFEYSKEIFSLAKLNNSKFIYASSAAVYGLNEDSEEISDNESPLNIYAESKLLFDKYIMSQEYQAVGLRYFNVYGRGEENKGKMASMAYKMNLEYKNSKMISLFKGTGGYRDGEQKRDFIYIDDVVSINIFFMRKSKHDIYNVGTGKPQKIIDLAKLIGGKVQSIPTRPGEPFRSCANIKKISSHLKWKPTVPFKEGVSKMMNELEKWKDAPLWTPKKIKKATQVWFKFMKK